jgi:hypothetical protein
MGEEMSSQDLKERLALIETMIAEGRRQTESWGWNFLLWGVAYYVAILWAGWGEPLTVLGRNWIAWPVTMIAAIAVNIWIASRRPYQAGTGSGRALGSLWSCLGISLLALILAFGISGRLEAHLFVSIIAGFLGFANGASGLILRWRAQVACAVLWWAASVAACFASMAQLTAVFLLAIFLCQIVFGIYAMTLDGRRRRRSGEAHA